jgi:hypothetical protein
MACCTIKAMAIPQTKHADLITEKQYEDFELSFDWKIAPAANSGILYMVTEEFAFLPKRPRIPVDR